MFDPEIMLLAIYPNELKTYVHAKVISTQKPAHKLAIMKLPIYGSNKDVLQ